MIKAGMNVNLNCFKFIKYIIPWMDYILDQKFI